MKAISTIATDVTVAWSVALYVCMSSSVTLVHPAKAVGRNGMPFCRDTHVIPSNILLGRGPGLSTGMGIWGSNPLFGAMPPIVKLLSPLFSLNVVVVMSVSRSCCYVFYVRRSEPFSMCVCCPTSYISASVTLFGVCRLCA